MENMEKAIENVLGNPEMMEKIMGMAQAFGMGGPPPQEASGEAAPPPPAMDPSKIEALSGLLGGAGLDSNQQNLLKALGPYLSGPRISKLKRAMGAARMAELAKNMLGSSMT